MRYFCFRRRLPCLARMRHADALRQCAAILMPAIYYFVALCHYAAAPAFAAAAYVVQR